MEIVYIALLTWTVVGAFQWFSWVVRIEDYEAIDKVHKLEGPWQWVWAGPAIWLLRFACYFVGTHMA